MKPMRRAVGCGLAIGVLLSGTLLQAAPWAVMVDSYNARIRTLDFGTVPPQIYGPFLEGQLGTAGGALLDAAWSPDGRFALFSNFGDAAIYRVNMANPKNPIVTGCVTSGFFAEDIDVTPNGRYALVTDGGYSPKLGVIDLTSFSTCITYTITSGYANAVAVAPDNQTVVMADYSQQLLISGVLCPTGLVSERTIYAGTNVYPVNVSIAPDGRTVIAANAQNTDRKTSIFRIASPGVLVTGATPFVSGLVSQGMQSVSFSPDGRRGYILQNGSMGTNAPNYLSWVNIVGPGRVTLGGTAVVALAAEGSSQLFGVDTLAVSPDGDWALAANPTMSGGTSVVSLVNLNTFTMMPIAGFADEIPTGVAFQPVHVSGMGRDFDGDGRADPAIYDARSGTWAARLSGSGGALTTVPNLLGGLGRQAAPADYDGDGLADPAVYLPRSGTWTAKLSASGYASTTVNNFLGNIGFAPAPADYDGDGLGDPAVYQEATGTWRVKLSGSGYADLEMMNFLGRRGYSLASADYDGDGLADPAVYNRINGGWKILASGSGYAPVELAGLVGGTGFAPVPADYDGDGLADPAVRSNDGAQWTFLYSAGIPSLQIAPYQPVTFNYGL